MRRIYYHSGLKQPYIAWRRAGQEEFTREAMLREGVGRSPGEYLWVVQLPVEAETVEFYFCDQIQRDPRSRWYECRTSLAFVQDGEIFTYRPAGKVEPARRGYHQPIKIFSQALQQERYFRVYLPRGYRQHLRRRYPVVYMQDGQNIFESGSFGSWNAHLQLDRCVRRGQVEEVIVVAVDHGRGRFDDYVPQEDGGQSQAYARFLAQELKPHIDRHYRTRSAARDTALVGSSLGAVASLSIAWDYFHTFAKVASLSGSWWLKKFQSRMAQQSRRPLKIYLDSGNAGPYQDCYRHSQILRDQLVEQGFAGGVDLCYVLAEGHTHTESAWGFRLPQALRFLFPVEECPEERSALPLALRRAA
jgi:enterochelin esterase-like enzyme